MILAVDVDYRERAAQVGGVVFHQWEDPSANATYVSQVTGAAGYEPGNFYKREMPCILSLLEEHSLKPQVIVIDGFVFLDGVCRPGLGKHLYDALLGQIAIVGVAKRPFRDIDEKFAVYRGESQNPLYVTAVGMDLLQAKDAVTKMHGKYRIPDLLKKADQVCRGNG